LFGALLFLGFWNKKLGILGAAGSCFSFVATLTIIHAGRLGCICRRVSGDDWYRSLSDEGSRSSGCVILFAEAGCSEGGTRDGFGKRHSAKVASYLRRSEEFGLVMGGFTVDMSAVRDRKRRMVSDLIDVHLDNYKRSGAELILGSGRFIGPKTLEATLRDGTSRQLRATNIVVGTGTRAALELIPGLVEAQPLTHVEALELDEIPKHLLVIGGGYVGLELSQAMRRFGSKVSVIERHDQLVHREDEDVTEALRGLFEDEGIDIVLNARVKGVSGKSGKSVRVVIEQNGVEKTLEGSHLLVAAGRTPNTEGIGLEVAGVELTERGYVKVNERPETTAPGVWAVGDVAGSPQFTHIGVDDLSTLSRKINVEPYG
jgi:pyruvate/2-oxoglutarate dehydrogenase complex dihydrolipoamide dehydrogenase (E3) component